MIRQLQVASEDPLDLAYNAIVRVADTASLLGAKHKRPICGRLGAELLLVADCLNSPDHDQEDRLRLRISKLMKAVETICRVSANRLTLIYSTWVIERDGKVVNIHVIVNAHFSGA